MVGYEAAANARFQNPAAQVSAHYGVCLDGRLVQWVDEADTAWHAGLMAANQASIGIEHEDGGNYLGTRPDALYAASSALVASICSRYGIPAQRGSWPSTAGIVDHRTIVATGCPDSLDTNRIIAGAALHGAGASNITGGMTQAEFDALVAANPQLGGDGYAARVAYGLGMDYHPGQPNLDSSSVLAAILAAAHVAAGPAPDLSALLAAIQANTAQLAAQTTELNAISAKLGALTLKAV